MHGTTILAVRHGGAVAIAGDGQVTLGQTVVKQHAKKIQRLHNGQVLAGFAGSTADALALIHRFEARLEEYRGNLPARRGRAREGVAHRPQPAPARGVPRRGRPRVHLPALRGRRRDRPDDGLVAVGSGGPMALAAARALVRHGTALDAGGHRPRGLRIASEICIYTNDTIEVETLAG